MMGLAISFIGLDPMTGDARFTLGLASLHNGVGLVAALIGMFGFAEIARGLIFEKDAASAPINRISVNWQALRHNLKSLLAGSFIGTFVGSLPAVGADTAAYLNYSAARATASEQERKLFGKGSYRGIIASETANNASIGGSLLPTMLLAIPGATANAAFMAALNLKGIAVGPMIQVFHPGVLEFTLASFVVISVLLGVVGYLFAYPAVYLLSVPRRILLPAILPICVLGAFAAQNSVTDIYVMLAFGLFALGLMFAGIPLAPLIMGLILGPLVDQNFRRAFLVYRDRDLSDLLSRPVGLVLLGAIVLTVALPLVRAQRRARRQSGAGKDTAA